VAAAFLLSFSDGRSKTYWLGWKKVTLFCKCRPAISLFVTDTNIEDCPPNCVIGNRTDDVIDDLIRFHEILSIDIMLRISIGVFEPIGFDLDAENWQNVWEPLKNGKFLVHRIITPEGEFKEVFNVEGKNFMVTTGTTG